MPAPTGPVYMYSGQKLRWTELAKEELRQKLAKVKNATFTYSTEFNSLTMPVVNETELAQLVSVLCFCWQLFHQFAVFSR